jgi:hypothetical protein
MTIADLISKIIGGEAISDHAMLSLPTQALSLPDHYGPSISSVLSYSQGLIIAQTGSLVRGLG